MQNDESCGSSVGIVIIIWAGERTNSCLFVEDGERFIATSKLPYWLQRHAVSYFSGDLGHFAWRKYLGTEDNSQHLM